MGRHKKYPDAENTIAAFYGAVSDSYCHPAAGEEARPSACVGDGACRKKQELLAEEFGISRLKVRKILITTGDRTYPETRSIQEMLAAGKSKDEICRQLKMAIATLNSFLPYEKGIYNLADVSNAAENCRIYRERKEAVSALAKAVQDGTEIEQQLALWKAICLFSGYPFRISGRGSRPGIKFKYVVSRAPGKSGYHYEGEEVLGFGNNELWIIQNGEKREKSISRSSVNYALKIVMGEAISGPKKLKIYGSSYVYAVFMRFGLISE